MADFQSNNEELAKERDCSELMMENLMSTVKDLQNQIKHSNPCSCCEKTFENSSELTVHMQNEHSNSQGTRFDDFSTPQQVAQEPNSKESPVNTLLMSTTACIATELSILRTSLSVTRMCAM